MTTREMILALGCSDASITAMSNSFATQGVTLRTVDSIAALAREAKAHLPLAVMLGIGPGADFVEGIDVIHAVREKIPIIVIAEEDSLELERKSREKNIFYYLVEPIDPEELEAVIQDAIRYGRDS